MLVKEELKIFSKSPIGWECWRWTLPIVEEVIDKWLVEKALDERLCKRTDNWNLGMIVGAVVYNQTRNNFSWRTASQIVKISGEQGMNEGIIALYDSKYPLGMLKFSTGTGSRGAKRVVTDLAKAILWVEAVKFLEQAGYDNESLPDISDKAHLFPEDLDPWFRH